MNKINSWRVVDFFRLLRIVDYSPFSLIPPIILVVLSVVFETTAVALYFPIVQGLSSGSFAFIEKYSGFRWLQGEVPFFFSSPLRAFLTLAGVAAASQLIRMFLRFASNIAISLKTKELEYQLRERVFGEMLYFGKRYFDVKPMGATTAYVFEYPATVRTELNNLISTLGLLLPSIGYVLLLFVASWKATLLSLVFLPFMHVTARPLIKRIARGSAQVAKNYKEMHTLTQRIISAMTVVKANSCEAQEETQFKEMCQKCQREDLKLIRDGLLLDSLLQLIAFLIMILVVLGALVVLSGEIMRTGATSVVWVFVMKRILDSGRAFGQIRHLFERLTPAVSHLLQHFSEKQKYALSDGRRTFSQLRQAIDIADVSFCYETHEVLRRVSFTLERGSVVALVGPSGAGKSTVVQLLLRLYDPSYGCIRIDGIDLREFQLKSWHRRVAYVDQSRNLFDNTLRSNLLYGIEREVNDEEIYQALEYAMLGSLVTSLEQGLETRIGERGIRLSGGESQRVAIARAMLKQADLLILDEATSALDANTERDVQLAIDHLVKESTALIIAHRFSTIKNADKIITLDKGELVEEGTLPELLRQQRLFAELWKAQELFY